MSEGELRRRLEVAGYRFQRSATGKHLWRHPDTEELFAEDRAFEMVRVEERRRLSEAGWERVEVGGTHYWRRPDTGRLYPRGPAFDVLRILEEGEGIP